MNDFTLFLIAFFIYISALFFYFYYFFARREVLARVGFRIVAVGVIFHTLALILRTVSTGHAPFANMYESISFFAWTIVVAYLIMEAKYKFTAAQGFIILVVVGLMALASSPLMPKQAVPLVPALQSYWLWLHVSVTLIGEAFFAVAFILSLMYIRVERREKGGKKTKSGLDAATLDQLSYRCISTGFPIFTLGGLIFGMIWAHKAWGSYWNWDPKETWTLVTWFIYALYLHSRLVMGWRGRRSAYIAVLGFLSALFTYFGVNYILSGLHSYR